MGKRGGKISPATEFKPGQSGNPKGRPKMPIELKECLANIPDADYQAIVDKLKDLAKKGNTRAIELILDRWAGKVTQSIDITDKTFIVKTPGRDDLNQQEE